MKLPYSLDGGAGSVAAVGLVVLQTDETMESELRGVFDHPGLGLYHSRIAMEAAVTAETLDRMRDDLPRAAALLPGAGNADGEGGLAVVGYGCTSGATVIGPETIDAIIRRVHPRARTTNPISAVIAAANALGVRRLGFVTPYVAEVSAAMRALLEQHGFEIAAFGSFEEQADAVVARIAETSVLDAIRTIGGADAVEAVFVSCTNLRSFGVIDLAEQAVGKPVITSNQALAWHMLRLADERTAGRGPGKLFQLDPDNRN